ncbi:hypothetical protein MRB53_038439 [Persea americana]|nr:hypothetical protein MRB53_038439 [Persea americana]
MSTLGRKLNDVNSLASAREYYDDNSAVARFESRNRTKSAHFPSETVQATKIFLNGVRRGSLGVPASNELKFVIPVNKTKQELLDSEDTDHNNQITIDDTGPKSVWLGTSTSDGHVKVEVKGTYMVSNLLQELTLAQDSKRDIIELSFARLNENPVSRLSRMIKDSFWHNLTRKIDADNIATVARDPKDWTDDPRPRVYVPHGAPEQYEYYSEIARTRPEIRLDVQWLAPDITPDYIRDLNDKPGLLAVAMDEVVDKDGKKTLHGKPFVVPGGRFNELYGWDSYMIALGLLVEHDRAKTELCKSMVENFCFCIKHYGKILNANRSYYLGRSQPPFLTDMTIRVYREISSEPGALDFLRNGMLAAIKEYYNVWMSEPRLDKHTGLSRYRPVGVGVPPETEATHFVHVLQPYADKHRMEYKQFVKAYNNKEILEPALDEYFLHDRAVRESGQ